VLREYLVRKYGFENIREKEPEKGEERMGFLTDLLLYNNPHRAAWEKADRVVDLLHLQPGQHVAEIAAGPGFYTLRLAKRVGPKGHVYATDPRPMHLEYLTRMVEKNRLENVEPVAARLNDLSVSNAVDRVFVASYYHIVYATSMEYVKDAFIVSIKKILKPEGTLAILDNSFVEGGDVPYRGSYIAKGLVISQLEHYGFLLQAQYPITSQRYLLIFKVANQPPPAQTGTPQIQARTGDPCVIEVNSKASVLHLGSLDSFDITEGGTEAAQHLLNALERKGRADLNAALEVYERIIPGENFGGEYTALQWFCEYLLAGEEQQRSMLRDRFVASYFEFWSKDEFSALREYLKRKYKLGKIKDSDPRSGQQRRGYLEDMILFNNPKREGWERTSKILDVLALNPGTGVADIGCGPGYYTFQFADLVGPSGHVYALDTNDRHVDYVASLARKYGASNVTAVVSKVDSICITNPVDVAFMCSLYHFIYATSSERLADAFFGSIRRALRTDGKLVVVDNALVEDTQLPYHGPYIAKELIVAQLKHYGFRLVSYHQFIPQRYVLVFQPEAGGGALGPRPLPRR
jgi:predicted methyltransferase